MRGLLVLLVLLFGAGSARAQSWSDPDLGRWIADGAASRETLWLRGETGAVVAFDRVSGSRAVVAETVADLLAIGDSVWVLVRDGTSSDFTLRDLRAPAEAEAEAVSARTRRLYLHDSRDSEGPVIGLFAWPGSDRPAILTSRTVVIPTASGWRRVRLASALDAGASIAAGDETTLYVGYNRGEWGGGLRRIDLSSGAISFVSAGADDRCDGQINPACDPVVGVFADAATPGCVIVGTGIAHMGVSSGDVFRVCGDDIAPIFSTPVPAVADQWSLFPQPKPLHGLFATADGWIGVSRDSYFRSQDGAVEEHTMPALRDWAGLRIGDEDDGVVLVIAACCWGSVDNPTLFSAIALPVSD